MTEELRRLRSLNLELDSKHLEYEKSASRSSVMLDAADQKVRDKEELLQQMSSRLQEAADQRSALEHSLELYKANTERLQGKFEASVKEITKGNEIIQALQSESKQLRRKLKLEAKVVRRQDSIIQERALEHDSVLREKARAHEDYLAEKRRVETLSAELERTKDALKKSSELLESNKQVIKWLNKEANERHIAAARPRADVVRTTAPAPFSIAASKAKAAAAGVPAAAPTPSKEKGLFNGNKDIEEDTTIIRRYGNVANAEPPLPLVR